MDARTVPRFTVRECFPLKSDRDRRQLYEAFLSIWNAPENHRLLSFEPQSFSASEVSGWFDAHRTHYARFYCACDKSEELAGIAVVITKDSSNIEIYGLGV
ncbi:MAG: hypothetical protein R3302_01165, partial [Sulfurimonadaceae bacterium]|nr:hypothetical protein [Sulfurimonadaceae bacterium]